MWKLKDSNLFRIYKKNEVARYLGLSEVTISNVINGKPCSKLVAYCMTKFLNNEAEIEDYFEKVGE